MELLITVLAILAVFGSLSALVSFRSAINAQAELDELTLYYDHWEEKTSARVEAAPCAWCGDLAGREFHGRSYGRVIGDQFNELKKERDDARQELARHLSTK